MSQAQREVPPAKNPLIWVALIVVVLIIFIFAASDRGSVNRQEIVLESPAQQDAVQTESAGTIEREEVAAPGVRARAYIRKIRAAGKPYPFEEVMAKGSSFASEGALADAHLIFFFAAREGYIEAMMTMAEMSDPTLFQADNNLLDQADAVQAYKWYSQALQRGFEPARDRLENLHQWASAEANYGNVEARHLLLNFN